MHKSEEIEYFCCFLLFVFNEYLDTAALNHHQLQPMRNLSKMRGKICSRD